MSSLPHRLRQEQRENCHRALERAREAREKQNVMYSKLKPLSPGKKPQTRDPTSERRVLEGRKSRRSDAEAEETRVNIDSFEARLKTMPALGTSGSPLDQLTDTTTGTVSIPSIGSFCIHIMQLFRSVVKITFPTTAGWAGIYW